MGENKNIKELDAFAKKYVKEIQQEKPSLDFTASLMDKIVEVKMAIPFKASPLISKKVWFAIVAIVIAVLGISYQSTGDKVAVLSKLDFSFIDNVQITTILDGVSISNTVLYAFLFFGLMIVVQFVYLKNHFNKRFN